MLSGQAVVYILLCIGLACRKGSQLHASVFFPSSGTRTDNPQPLHTPSTSGKPEPIMPTTQLSVHCTGIPVDERTRNIYAVPCMKHVVAMQKDTRYNTVAVPKKSVIVISIQASVYHLSSIDVTFFSSATHYRGQHTYAGTGYHWSILAPRSGGSDVFIIKSFSYRNTYKCHFLRIAIMSRSTILVTPECSQCVIFLAS